MVQRGHRHFGSRKTEQLTWLFSIEFFVKMEMALDSDPQLGPLHIPLVVFKRELLLEIPVFGDFDKNGAQHW